MRILSVNSINFGAKNSSIRTADNIMRKAGEVFPITSSTYIDTFYRDTVGEKSEKKKKVIKNLTDTIERSRDIYLAKHPVSGNMGITDEDIITPFGVLLKCLSQTKKGNCYERSAAVLAALAANGYYDSKRVSLYLKTEYSDKKNNKKVYSHLADLDHNFVVTSMGKNSNKEKDLVVVDPWLSFTDSISGAKSKFKQLLYKDCIEPVEKKERETFIKKMALSGKEINVDKDYKHKQKLVFINSDIILPSEIKILGDYAGKMYSKLIINSD